MNNEKSIQIYQWKTNHIFRLEEISENRLHEPRKTNEKRKGEGCPHFAERFRVPLSDTTISRLN